VPRLFGEVFGWVGQRGLTQTGAPLIRYLVTDMERPLEIEVGVPVGAAVSGDARVKPGVLPAGRYATLVHTGPYDRVQHATGALLDWAAKNGIVWQMTTRGDTDVWAARVEYYPTDPQQEPDPEKWVTELAFLVAT
jgi:effector-binding domain-containing protein